MVNNVLRPFLLLLLSANSLPSLAFLTPALSSSQPTRGRASPSTTYARRWGDAIQDPNASIHQQDLPYESGAHWDVAEEDDPSLVPHGRHVCVDYTNFRVPSKEGGQMVIKAMREAVAESNVREVHSHMVVLGDDGQSPPGFTAVCLIDESHVTAHCYSDRGWLAIDVFTCGSHPPEIIADKLHKKLAKSVPELVVRRRVTLPRFLHPFHPVDPSPRYELSTPRMVRTTVAAV